MSAREGSDRQRRESVAVRPLQRPGRPKSEWNRSTLPESSVVKLNADLLAFEALPGYIAITKAFKLVLREEAGGWQKNARRVNSTRVPLLVYYRGRPQWRQDREGLVSKDLKRVGALVPLGQKRTVWIRTCNLFLTKRTALTTEP